MVDHFPDRPHAEFSPTSIKLGLVAPSSRTEVHQLTCQCGATVYAPPIEARLSRAARSGRGAIEDRPATEEVAGLLPRRRRSRRCLLNTPRSRLPPPITSVRGTPRQAPSSIGWDTRRRPHKTGKRTYQQSATAAAIAARISESSTAVSRSVVAIEAIRSYPGGMPASASWSAALTARG